MTRTDDLGRRAQEVLRFIDTTFPDRSSFDKPTTIYAAPGWGHRAELGVLDRLLQDVPGEAFAALSDDERGQLTIMRHELAEGIVAWRAGDQQRALGRTGTWDRLWIPQLRRLVAIASVFSTQRQRRLAEALGRFIERLDSLKGIAWDEARHRFFRWAEDVSRWIETELGPDERDTFNAEAAMLEHAPEGCRGHLEALFEAVIADPTKFTGREEVAGAPPANPSDESRAKAATLVNSSTPHTGNAGSQRPLVISIHGIRTHGKFQEDLERQLDSAGFSHFIAKYGYFSFLSLINPSARKRKLAWFRDHVWEAAYRDNGNVPPSVIAHSFGSYLVCRSMQMFPHIRFHRIIVCGSILDRQFAWSALRAEGRFHQVLHDYGRQDFWAGVAKYVVSDAGDSGQYGFTDEAGGAVLQRRNPEWGHSEYFHAGNYRDSWIPFLLGNTISLKTTPAPPGNVRPLLLCLALLVILSVATYAFMKHTPAPPLPGVPRPSETPVRSLAFPASPVRVPEDAAVLRERATMLDEYRESLEWNAELLVRLAGRIKCESSLRQCDETLESFVKRPAPPKPPGATRPGSEPGWGYLRFYLYDAPIPRIRDAEMFKTKAQVSELAEVCNVERERVNAVYRDVDFLHLARIKANALDKEPRSEFHWFDLVGVMALPPDSDKEAYRNPALWKWTARDGCQAISVRLKDMASHFRSVAAACEATRDATNERIRHP